MKTTFTCNGSIGQLMFLGLAVLSTLVIVSTFCFSMQLRSLQAASGGVASISAAKNTTISMLHKTIWKYIINEKELCATGGGNKSDYITLLLIIPSALNDNAARQAVRATYASVSRKNSANVRHVFFFGISKSEMLNRKVRAEHNVYHDVVQIDAVDSYDNLTLKVIAGLKWSTVFCAAAKYIMKLDTDTWLNVNKLSSLISSPAFSLRNAIGGSLHNDAQPIRDPKHKWYTSVLEYPKNVFPRYCAGPGYIITSGVARGIMRASQDIPYFRMEDVYMGMCADALKYTVKHIMGFHYLRTSGDPCKLNNVITSHNHNPEELIAAWNSNCTSSMVMVPGLSQNLFISTLLTSLISTLLHQ